MQGYSCDLLNSAAQGACGEFPSGKNPDLRSRIKGCWLGKSIGGTLGLPAEGKMERLNFSFYDPLPTSAPPNDDLELQLVWLHLIEQSGTTLRQSDFAKAWLEHIHYMWDEYGRCRWNLRRGVPIECVGTFENSFHAGMGSPIRSEIWACLFPGDPQSAAHYSALDASLDHGIEGIAGEVFLAVMQSSILGGVGLDESIAIALRYIPSSSETARAAKLVMNCHREQVAEWHCWEQLLARHGNENFTHAPLNVALSIWALAYGRGDFEKSILLAVNGGYDTDCTAATVGASLGSLSGAEGIPDRWIAPIGEEVCIGAGIKGIVAPTTLTELTDRTISILGKLEPKSWDGSMYEAPHEPISLDGLPGTIRIQPLDCSESIPWANGELPRIVKQAGGANWFWDVTYNEPREITCLASGGARLYLDGELIIDSPPGLPYVPAPHRSPDASRVRIQPAMGRLEVRLELGSRADDQEASVILAYPNFHICPWTPEELPHLALL